MRILIITSCTGEKAVADKRQLLLADFEKGAAHVRAREKEITDLLRPAGEMYTGEQHLRLMRGVSEARKAGVECRVEILSAGYGFIPEDRRIAPYEATFATMSPKETQKWSQSLDAPDAFRRVVAEPYDLGLILLGDNYLRACALDAGVMMGGRTILFAGKGPVGKLPRIPNLRCVTLSNPEARRFSCGLVGLKGEVANRLLHALVAHPGLLASLGDPATDILGLLDGDRLDAPAEGKRPKARANPVVDRVIDIPQSWWDKPHRKKLMYFIPEWDDLVDPDYDFVHDEHSGGSGDWSNQVYAHQLYPEPSYDGILMSRAVAEKSKKKNARITSTGVHRFLRVPRNYPIMGDCGAFDYIDAKEPPYTTDDVLDYYTRLDFDFGVSVDHLIVPAFESERKFRYDLTIHNAEEFIKKHQRQKLRWEPIGAVQGWDPKAYASAAANYVKMGYRYIALGGLVRSTTPEILRTLKAVREVVPTAIRIHILGFSRFDALGDLVKLGANSIDSASMLRKAWLGANLNYLTADGWYSAIRVPQAEGSFRAKHLIGEGGVTLNQLQRLEHSCLSELRTFAQSATTKAPPKSLLDHLCEYDALVAGERVGTRARIRRTLEDRPWARCPCAICKKWGVEVAVFRGNNRNRRRGFHNTYVFYNLLQRLVDGERIPWIHSDQQELPMSELATL